MNGSVGRANRVPLGLATVMGLAACVMIPVSSFAAGDSRVWGQDPFGAPPGESHNSGLGLEQAPGTLAELQGIIAGPGGMVAIVDERIVRIGDRVGAELVEEITPRAVVLRRGPHVRRLVISVLPMQGR